MKFFMSTLLALLICGCGGDEEARRGAPVGSGAGLDARPTDSATSDLGTAPRGDTTAPDLPGALGDLGSALPAITEPKGAFLRCSGGEDSVTVPIGKELQEAQAFTVELWFRPDALAALEDPEEFLLFAPGPDEHRQTFSITLDELGVTGTRPLNIEVLKQNEDAEGCSGARGTGWLEGEPEVGRWTHVAFTFDHAVGDDQQAQFVLYVDGKRKVSSRWPADEAPCVQPESIVLCRPPAFDTPFGMPFQGSIDEVHISAIKRYDDAFAPALAQADEHTLVLLRFDGGLVDEGPFDLDVRPGGAASIER